MGTARKCPANDCELMVPGGNQGTLQTIPNPLRLPNHGKDLQGLHLLKANMTDPWRLDCKVGGILTKMGGRND